MQERLRGTSSRAHSAILVGAKSNTDPLPVPEAAPVGVRGGSRGGVGPRNLGRFETANDWKDFLGYIMAAMQDSGG